MVAGAVGGPEADLAVELDVDCPVRVLTDALRDHFGVDQGQPWCLHVERLGTALDPDDTAGRSGLRFGDRVTLAPPGWAPAGAPDDGPAEAGLVLSVVGGPAAGRQVGLARGTTTVGRAAGSDVRIEDPTLSSQHLRIAVTDKGVTIEDAGSSGGSFVGERRLSQPVDALKGAVVEAGSSLFRVDVRPAASRRARSAGPVVSFNRPPRLTPPPADRIFKLRSPPTRPEKGRIPMASALGPLALGLPMVFLGTGAMRMFGIVSVVVSPLLALGSYLEDRRGGKGKFQRDLAAFYDDLHALSAKMRLALIEEVASRWRTVPDATDVLDRCASLRADLWERRPVDPDFLQVGVGWADQTSTATVEIGDGGDEDLRKEAEAELARWGTARNVPVVIDLANAGVAGLCGNRGVITGTVSWILVQLAAMHSPRDLVIATAVTKEESGGLAWASWLPHFRSETSPFDGPHLAVGDEAAAAMFETVSGVVRTRRAGMSNRLGTARKPLPALVLFVSERLNVPRTAITTVLEDGPGVAVYVVWLGEDANHLPGECGAIVDSSAKLPTLDFTLPNVGQRLKSVVADRLSTARASRAARALSGVKDVTAGGVRGQIPRNVPLLDLLALPQPSPSAIAERWRTASMGVDAPVGVSAGGPFVLDMRKDGPHALVGGTTGAGKSELLQSFVAALAAAHPPNRLTFVLIDYKGGAAFKDVVHLPHTVGFVTDLDGHLVFRALVSLNAELRRREHLLRDHGAKDLLEMERRMPEVAPPSLLLIVDEFASLAKELPEFVDGVVNVAQRGRSLGIHLILATQRPAGSINDNVRANTNLRIALRMNDAADSEDVIGANDAAMLPRTLPGRAFVRTGQTEMNEVQVAYVGGHTTGRSSEAGHQVEIMGLELGQVIRTVGGTTSGDEDAPTDLQVLVEAAVGAADAEHIPPQRPPWLPPLPAVLPLDGLPDGGARRGQAFIGLVDLPERQAQELWWFDLEEEGSLLVYGTGGSGKTSLLRSLAVSLALGHSPAELQMYGLDFASRGLGPLEGLPHVGSVVAGEDVERVQRLVVLIETEISRRKNLFAAAGASLLSEYERSDPGVDLPRMVVLFDGYGGFTTTFEKIDFGEWIERFPRLVSEGRPLGIHFVITADRRNAVGMTMSSSVGSRVVFRMADTDDYATIGLDGRVAKGATLGPGRGFVGATVEVQAAMVGDDPAGDAQGAAVEATGAKLRAQYPDAAVPKIGSLPTEVDRATMPTGEALSTMFAIGQSALAPVGIDLFDGNLLVAGPNRSGRSTALASMAIGLHASTPDARLYALAPRRSPLLDLDIWESSARGAAACDELATELVDLIADRDGSEPAIVVFVDDGTEIADAPADEALERIARQGRDVAMCVIGAAESTSAMRSYGGWIPEVRKNRRALLLNPDADIDGDLAGVRLPRRASGLPPGRGYLVTDGNVELVHVAM